MDDAGLQATRASLLPDRSLEARRPGWPVAGLLVSGANFPMLNEPANNADPARREEMLAALAGYRRALLLVAHDEGAVQALQPQRVVLMPEGIADLWDASLTELVSMA